MNILEWYHDDLLEKYKCEEYGGGGETEEQKEEIA